MTYVLELNGVGDSPAESVTLLNFDSDEEATDHIETNEKLYIKGNEYWKEFDIVTFGEVIKTTFAYH